MILECYFDSANKPTVEHDRVVLAMACGTPEQWKGFNADWNSLLANYPAPPLHTKEAVSLWGEFKGWTHDRVDDFILKGVAVIAKHIAIPLPNAPRKLVSGLGFSTLTIFLDDYVRARDAVPLLPNSVNDILVSESMGFCFRWGRRIGAEEFHLHFDRGEPFRGLVMQIKNSKQARQDVPIFNKVTVHPPAESSVTPGLQVADLFAWCISHNDKTTRWWHRVLNDLPWDSRYLDYAYLTNPNRSALERTLRWNLPRRGRAPADREPGRPE